MDSKVKPKQKRRNSERRKEKSRDAARCRRSKETEIFQDLASLLPLPSSTVSSLDKASVMRLAISFLKTKQILNIFPLPDTPAPSVPVPEDSLFLKALDGFVLVVSAEGDLVFLSENVNEHLGLSHVELMGQSIYELTHPCDHSEVKSILTAKDLWGPRSIFIRLKCTLTSKGRNVNVKAAGYKVIHCTGHLVRSQNEACGEASDSDTTPAKENSQDTDDTKHLILLDTEDDAGYQSADKVTAVLPPPGHCFVAIGEPIPHPANYDVPLSRTFLTKHSLDMKFTYADETMEEYLGYNPDIFISKSVFEFHHTQDSFHVQQAFKNLFAKGQCQTDRYRFLASGGGYIWVLTQATLIYNKCQKAQSVVCVNFVISGIEQPKQIFSLCQLPKLSSVKASPPVSTATVSKPIVTETPRVVPNPAVVATPQPPPLKPIVRVVVPTVVPKPQVPAVQPKPLTAPLEKILPLPNGFTVPKVTSFASLLTPLPPKNTTVTNVRPPQNNALADQSGTIQSINNTLEEPVRNIPTSAPLVDQRGTNALNVTPLVATDSTKAAPDPNSLAAKFLPTISLDSPVVRAVIAVNNALTQAPRPQAATAKIFAPRTEEMNKGYLTFVENTGMTMLKDEPEDLTHLAPTAGDACIPLEDTSELLMDGLLDEFILSDNYNCPMLSEASDNSKQMADMSPTHSFYPYRDDRSLSPDALTHSPDACSLPSLSSMEDSPPMIEDSMHSLWGLDLVSSSEDLSIRAPYIPMPTDDLPLVTTDLMWGAGPTPPKPLTSDPLLSSHSKTSAWSTKSHAHLSQNNQNHQNQSSSTARCSSSLAKLLKADSYSGRCNLEDAGGGVNPSSMQQTQHTKYNSKYSTKKGSTSGGSTQSVLERKPSTVPSNKRCATPPEWDHRGYWKRSRTPSTTVQSGLCQAQTARHNSVLMNLLVSGCDKPPLRTDQALIDRAEVAKRIRLKSLTAMDTDISGDLGDLTTQDYEVNAPTSDLLLGEDLLSALECFKT